jgi:ATP-dependent Zn protease
MTLVILAAGMGSRYGGLKQIDPITAEGEFIIDFSVYDAALAGFDKVVFVIKRENLELFRETIGKRFENKIKVEYAFQELADLPSGFSVPEGRVKPWGTAHALLAARNGKTLIGMTEIEDAMIKVTVGTQKKARKMSEKEKRNTAVHEAGHAILAHVLETQDPVRQISIIPSGRALGYTLTPPVEDKYSESKQEMKERIAMMLGGRVAEQICFGDYTGGASNDIMRATQVARKMVTVYGMSDELGTIHFGSDHSSDAVFLGRDFSSTPDY